MPQDIFPNHKCSHDFTSQEMNQIIKEDKERFISESLTIMQIAFYIVLTVALVFIVGGL